jgi:hypothetical protein
MEEIMPSDGDVLPAPDNDEDADDCICGMDIDDRDNQLLLRRKYSDVGGDSRPGGGRSGGSGGESAADSERY